MKISRLLIAVLIVVIIVPAVVLAFFVAEFDPNRYAPALTSAVEKATGRQLTLGSPIKLSLSLSPEISASNIKLANPSGFADPDLVTISRLEARIELLPLFLHQIDIVKLVVFRPDIVLETTSRGSADWDLTPPSGAEAWPAAAQTHPPGQNQSDYKVTLEAVEIQDGLILLRPAHSSHMVRISVASLTGTAVSAASPLNLNAQASFEGVPVLLNGFVGPVARFSGAGSGPWPVELTLTSPGATATIDGIVSEPRTVSGYDLSVKYSVPALEVLADALPSGLINKADLPPIHGIVGSAEIADQDAQIPAINNFTIHAGASDLSSVRPGLTLTGLNIEAPSLTSPLSVKVTGAIGKTPISLAGTFGVPSRLINPAWLPAVSTPATPDFPVSIEGQVGNSTLQIDGGIATPMKLAGAALNVKASIPDLSSLSPLAGASLPNWKNIIAQGTLIDPGGLDLMSAIGIESLILNMDDAALGGDLSWYFGIRPRLQISLKTQQINLDPLLAAWPAAPVPEAPAAAPPPTPNSTNYLLPAAKLPIATLQTSSADIQVSADSLIFHHATYNAIQGHAVLANGVLIISPLTALIPGGGIAANATVDASKDPAAATLSVEAPALALSPFLNAIGLPSAAEGTLQAGLSASGTGDSLQYLASSVQGQFGMAMVNGTVDGQVLSRLFGAALTALDLPASLVGAQGPVAVRCFGLRVDAEEGIGRISALALDSNRLLLQGGGSLNFGNETLGLILQPQLRVAGNVIGVPVKIGGTFADPTASVAPLAAVQEAAKTAVGLAVSLAEDVPGANTLLGKFVSSTGSATTGDVCPAALSLARLGKPGPEAAAEPTSASAGANASMPVTGPKSLLNALFGK
jgi:AsmA protein